MRQILIIGATGQIGSELTPALRARYGGDNVVAAGHRTDPSGKLLESGPFEYLDVRYTGAIESLVKKYKIDTIFHLASLLSAVAEAKPQAAWELNMNGLYNVLEVARKHGCSLFFPSSIGAFGPSTPRDNTPQLTIQRPNTMYGVTKVSGELLCDYYHKRFGVDTRGVRFPGLISHESLPGGGTTDYAVEIFYAALQKKRFTCPIHTGTYLDMMYMEDAIRAAIELMEAEPDRLEHRNAYNVTAMSFSPEELFREIQKSFPDFAMNYEVDPVLQTIADSWPNSMDDSDARKQWGWQPEYDLPEMSKDMIKKLSKKLFDR